MRAASGRVAVQAAAHCGTMVSGGSWPGTTMMMTTSHLHRRRLCRRQMKWVAQLDGEEWVGVGLVACGWASELRSGMSMRTTLTV